MIRFGIFAAVSSRPQIEGDSLEVQERTCREAGISRGWVEGAGPFIVMGESRTKWLSLENAQEHIVNPDGSRPIRELLDQAQSGKYNILITYSYDRLRDLTTQLYSALKRYNVQICSTSEDMNIQEPAKYAPYNDDVKIMNLAMFQMKSSMEISTLQRRRRIGMPGRILKKGLASSIVPYGYRKPAGMEFDRFAVPVPDPVEAQVVTQIKDMYLAGQSLYTIRDELNRQGSRSHDGGPWGRSSIAYILRNPYYAGIARWQYRKTILDPRTGKRRALPSPEGETISAKGAHQPLWDDNTYQSIIAEMSRRAERAYHGPLRTYPLSNLVVCGNCGSTMFHEPPSPKSPHEVYRCKNPKHTPGKHARYRADELMQMVGDELVRQLPVPTTLRRSDAPGPGELLAGSLAELTNRKRRVGDGYDAGIYTLAETAERTAAINTQIEAVQARMAEAQKEMAGRAVFDDTVEGLRAILDKIPEWMAGDDPMTVNRTLRQILEQVVVHPDRIELIFK